MYYAFERMMTHSYLRTSLLQAFYFHSKMNLLTTLCADDGLFRVSEASLSDQTRLEMLVSDFKHQEQFKDKEGDLLSIKDWPGVMLNWREEADKICWKNVARMDGPISLDLLPPTLTECDLSQPDPWQTMPSGTLTGTLETIRLPRGLKSLSLSKNAFHGTLDCASLPPDLKRLNVSQNNFEGSLELDVLPSDMVHFNVYKNNFSGNVLLDDLPKNLQSLMISNNALSGTLSTAKLPPNLNILEISSNAFTGSVALETLPVNLEVLFLGHNEFSGSIRLDSLPAGLTSLALNNNGFDGSVSLDALPAGMQSINIMKNEFQGTIDASKLPPDARVRVSKKNFEPIERVLRGKLIVM